MKNVPSDGAGGTPFRIVPPFAGVLVGVVASLAIVSAGAWVFGPVSDARVLALSGVTDVGVAGSGKTAPGAADIRVARVDALVGFEPAFP